MSNRDACPTRFGLHVWGDEAAEQIVLGTRRVSVGTRPLFVDCEDLDGVWTAFAGGDDLAYLVHPDGELEPLGPTAGIRNVLVTELGVYWTERGKPCTHYWHRAWDGTRTRHVIPIGGTSQGLSYQDANGRLWWADELSQAPPTVGNVTFYDASVHQSWTFGTTPGNRVIAAKAGQVFDTWLDGVMPKGRELPDGSAVVAANRHGTFGESKDWTPYQPKPLKPIPVPSLTRLIWRGMDGWDGTTVHRMPGNFAWSEQPGTPVRNVLEGPPWSADVEGSLLAVLIGTERDYKPFTSKERQLAAAIADAALKSCPVAVYSDGPTFTATAEGFAKRVKAEGCDVVRVLQFYPPTTKTEVENEIKRLKAKGSQLGLMVPVYTANGAWSEADLERVLTEAQSLIAKYYPLIRIESAFGGKRADASDRAVAYMAGVIAAMPAGDPPPLVDPAPHPEPEPQPKPEPDDAFFPQLEALW